MTSTILILFFVLCLTQIYLLYVIVKNAIRGHRRRIENQKAWSRMIDGRMHQFDEKKVKV